MRIHMIYVLNYITLLFCLCYIKFVNRTVSAVILKFKMLEGVHKCSELSVFCSVFFTTLFASVCCLPEPDYGAAYNGRVEPGGNNYQYYDYYENDRPRGPFFFRPRHRQQYQQYGQERYQSNEGENIPQGGQDMQQQSPGVSQQNVVPTGAIQGGSLSGPVAPSWIQGGGPSYGPGRPSGVIYSQTQAPEISGGNMPQGGQDMQQQSPGVSQQNFVPTGAAQGGSLSGPVAPSWIQGGGPSYGPGRPGGVIYSQTQAPEISGGNNGNGGNQAEFPIEQPMRLYPGFPQRLGRKFRERRSSSSGGNNINNNSPGTVTGSDKNQTTSQNRETIGGNGNTSNGNICNGNTNNNTTCTSQSRSGKRRRRSTSVTCNENNKTSSATGATSSKNTESITESNNQKKRSLDYQWTSTSTELPWKYRVEDDIVNAWDKVKNWFHGGSDETTTTTVQSVAPFGSLYRVTNNVGATSTETSATEYDYYNGISSSTTTSTPSSLHPEQDDYNSEFIRRNVTSSTSYAYNHELSSTVSSSTRYNRQRRSSENTETETADNETESSEGKNNDDVTSSQSSESTTELSLNSRIDEQVDKAFKKANRWIHGDKSTTTENTAAIGSFVRVIPDESINGTNSTEDYLGPDYANIPTENNTSTSNETFAVYYEQLVFPDGPDSFDVLEIIEFVPENGTSNFTENFNGTDSSTPFAPPAYVPPPTTPMMPSSPVIHPLGGSGIMKNPTSSHQTSTNVPMDYNPGKEGTQTTHKHIKSTTAGY